ncbi:MAG: XRE family transcriptional regulator [Clostridia bacterium]|nr:XRE family transcriptional regulator [Clostridia bacterium]
MDKAKTTRELLNVLKGASDARELKDYVDAISADPPAKSFAELFRSLPRAKAADNARMIVDTNIERTYFYQILNGTRKPGRDKLLLLCLAARLGLEDTRRCLEANGSALLYSRSRRDAIVIFALQKGLSASETNELLDEFGEEILV